MTASELQAHLLSTLGSRGPLDVEVQDDSHLHAGHAGAREGRHFSLRLRGDCFNGLGRVARHRLVYDSLGPLPALGIHALAIDARAADES